MGDSGKKDTPGIDVVVFTAAVHEDNPELIAALPFPSERDTAYKIGISAAAQITRKNRFSKMCPTVYFIFPKLILSPSPPGL